MRVAAALHLPRRPHCGLALLRCAVRGADALTTVRCGLRGVPSACRSLGPKDTVSVLSVQAVAKRFGERLVFSEVSFRLAHGDRVGLVGPNGVGKTTLLRVAAGLESADAGNVALARGTR
ncbi:MAG: ATP-binding cassette domain-containing protein, partial [Chloroflexi bacterium]